MRAQNRKIRLAPQSTRPVGAVSYCSGLTSASTKIDSGDNPEPAAELLDAHSCAGAPQDGPNRPSPESTPRATAPHGRLQVRGR